MHAPGLIEHATGRQTSQTTPTMPHTIATVAHAIRSGTHHSGRHKPKTPKSSKSGTSQSGASQFKPSEVAHLLKWRTSQSGASQLSPLKNAPPEVEHPNLNGPKWHTSRSGASQFNPFKESTSRSGAFQKLNRLKCRTHSSVGVILMAHLEAIPYGASHSVFHRPKNNLPKWSISEIKSIKVSYSFIH
ncbi:hypothetical protein JCGZ_13570 [Jatropha curcas]|uniref:Uncharacterized protein n=1 Tax=Jatropha curcas TaxID=180498 RepID=A0A067KDN1_JATCU|nr:hypothetical protein JCGZ_13570 [Jatropha curcas]